MNVRGRHSGKLIPVFSYFFLSEPRGTYLEPLNRLRSSVIT